MVNNLDIYDHHNMPVPKMDYENYSLLVRNGGIIAFHDVRPADIPGHLEIPQPETAMYKALEEYFFNLRFELLSKTNWRTIHILCRHDERDERPGGIGVIIKE